MYSALLPWILLLTILLYFISLENGTSEGKYPDGILIFSCDAKRNVDLKNQFQRWYLDQKMCLKVLAVAVFMVRGISLIKDFCVVDTKWL